MAEPILVWLAPGALGGGDPASQAVRWSEPSAAPVSSTLAQLPTGRAVRLVLSVADVLLTEVNLNRRQARHLQRVLPWLLEDQLTALPEHYWFVSGKPRDGRYPVVACDRAALETLLYQCRELGVHPVGVAVDAQLLGSLAPSLIAIDDQIMVLAEPLQAVQVPAHQAPAVLAVLGLESLMTENRTASELLDVMQGALRAGHGIELLQGDLRPAQEQKTHRIPAPWRRLGMLAAACVVAVGIMLVAQGWRYQAAAAEQRARAASLYSELFPGDSATALLESQFRNRLARLGGGSRADFAGLMAPVGDAMASAAGRLSPRRIQYDERDNALTMDVDAPDYDTLEALRQRLSEGGLDADIANYRSQGERVTARLRVAMGS